MKVELAVALIAGVMSLGAAGFTAWNATALAKLKVNDELRKEEVQRQQRVSKFSEPLARAAFDLQSRFSNILKQDLIGAYIAGGNERERSYVINNTAFVIANYLCWTEVVKREIQFIDLGQDQKTRELLRLQVSISDFWGTDHENHFFRIFAGEQGAIGEALIQPGSDGRECMGYGTFLRAFPPGQNPLIDAIRLDVVSSSQATERLTNLQHALIDLLNMLDPDNLRFPPERRSKV
jgi:hypothetical protein